MMRQPMYIFIMRLRPATLCLSKPYHLAQESFVGKIWQLNINKSLVSFLPLSAGPFFFFYVIFEMGKKSSFFHNLINRRPFHGKQKISIKSSLERT